MLIGATRMPCHELAAAVVLRPYNALVFLELPVASFFPSRTTELCRASRCVAALTEHCRERLQRATHDISIGAYALHPHRWGRPYADEPGTAPQRARRMAKDR